MTIVTMAKVIKVYIKPKLRNVNSFWIFLSPFKGIVS
jgi:hypothetical protein